MIEPAEHRRVAYSDSERLAAIGLDEHRARSGVDRLHFADDPAFLPVRRVAGVALRDGFGIHHKHLARRDAAVGIRRATRPDAVADLKIRKRDLLGALERFFAGLDEQKLGRLRQNSLLRRAAGRLDRQDVVRGIDRGQVTERPGGPGCLLRPAESRRAHNRNHHST